MKEAILTVTLNPSLDKTITLNSFYEGGLNRAIAVRWDAGGKGINVAKVLTLFGAEVVATGVMGEEGSDALLAELQERGVQHDFYMTKGRTRTNYKLLNEATRKVTEINEPGFFVSPEALAHVIEKIEKKLPEVAVMVLAGSAARGISEDIYEQLTKLAHKHQVKVILDADGDKLRAGLRAEPYAIKPNLHELEELHGGAFSTDEAMYAFCRSLLSQNTRLVIVSLGKDGAAYITEQEAWRIKLPPANSQSTVGAGDSMVAMTAYSLLQNLPLQTLAELASAAGTVTATKPGTEVCRPEEVEAYRLQLKAQRLW